MRFQILTNASSVTAGSAFSPLRRGGRYKMNQGTVQVAFNGGVATVDIQGRGDPSAPWITLVSFSSDDAQVVQLMNEMRANQSAYTSGGPVNAWMDI